MTTYEGTMQNGAKRRHKDVVLAASSALALALSVEMSVAADPEPKTPIRYIVVIYDENISFDHYFGTYPNAANLPGETPLHAAPGTPTVNGLSGALITRNPNSTVRSGLTAASRSPATWITPIRPSRKRITAACSIALSRQRPRMRNSRTIATPSWSWATKTATRSLRYGTTPNILP